MTAAERRGNASLNLALATAAFVVCFIVWGLVAPLAPVFRRQFGLSATEVGMLIAIPTLLGSLARVPLGLLTDRYGGRVVFTALMLVLLIPTAIAGFVGSFGTLVVDLLFLGLAGASFAVGVPFVVRWFPPERQGFALGLYGMGNIGTAVAAFVAPRVAGGFGWQVVFWACLPLLLAMALIFWLAGRDAPGRVPNTAPIVQRFAVFRQQPVSWVLALFYFVTFGGFVAIGAYLPTLLVGEYHLEPVDAGTQAASFVVLATLARPLGGLLADRWGGAVVLNIVFSIVALLAILLAFKLSMLAIMLTFLGIAFALGLGSGAVFKLVADFFPKETGVVTGLVGAAGGLGGFFPPLLMGAVRDLTESYAIGFMLLSEFALVCLIVNLLVLQRQARLLEPLEYPAAVQESESRAA